VEELVSPRNDLVFKQIFGNEKNTEVLAAFLDQVLELPEGDLESVTLGNTHLWGDTWYGKQAVLDVLLTTVSGRMIDVEIQVRVMPNLRERLTFYNARMLSSQPVRGDDYSVLRQAVAIMICGENICASEAYHYHFELYDERERESWSDLLQIHILELCKLPAEPDGTGLWEWVKFLNVSTYEELEMAEKLDPMIGEAATVVRHFNEDEEARIQAMMHEKWVRDQTTWRNHARREGLAEGRAEGLAEGRAAGNREAMERVALSALASGFEIAQIAALTGLSNDEIRALRDEQQSD
jgi:predicted transposase/invertase (TIGR01784 family)